MGCGLPWAQALLADRGRGADWFHDAPKDKGSAPHTTSWRGSETPVPHDPDLKRHRIQNRFARLNDWRRLAKRYDRCPKGSVSACALRASKAGFVHALDENLDRFPCQVRRLTERALVRNGQARKLSAG